MSVSGQPKTAGTDKVKEIPAIIIKAGMFPHVFEAVSLVFRHYSGSKRNEFALYATKEQLGWWDYRLRKMLSSERERWAIGSDGDRKLLDEKFKLQEEREIINRFIRNL